MEKKFTNALMITGVVIFLSGIASRNLLATHIIVNRNWLPDLALGNGPTQSTITCSNGSTIIGIGDRGAGGIT